MEIVICQSLEMFGIVVELAMDPLRLVRMKFCGNTQK